MITSVAVFCGSSAGNNSTYTNSAGLLGKELAEHHITLVYGGARIGLMGAVAEATLSAGGKATGVIPRFLRSKEIAHDGLTNLILVDSMHERKTRMFELSDAFVALPGGFGTLEELFEILTWAQLGLHQKPVLLLNVEGYYNALVTLLDSMVEKGFVKPVNRQMLLVADYVDQVLPKLRSYHGPDVSQWLTEKAT